MFQHWNQTGFRNQTAKPLIMPDSDFSWNFTREAHDFYIMLPFEYLIILEINYIECSNRKQYLFSAFPRLTYLKYLNSSLKSGKESTLSLGHTWL